MSESRLSRQVARKRAAALVAQMTTDEKIAQLEHDAPAIARLALPAYHYWNEGLHGVARAGTATMFPQPIGLAAMFDPKRVHDIAATIAIEGRAKYNAAVAKGDRDIYKGLTYWSPNINIFRDPRWGRGHETYGEDPFLTAKNGVAFIEGLQGNGKYLRLAACAKHFAVHSGPEKLRHSFDAKVNAKDFNETYLPAFKAAVEQGHVEAVMSAYNAVNGTPAPVNADLLQTKLRGEWGFEGHVVSDVGAEEDVARHHHYSRSDAETMALALKAGCDLCAGNIARYLNQALSEGLVTVNEMDAALVRLLTSRILLGLNAPDNPDDQIPFTEIDSPAHHQQALEATYRTFVLLKNDQGLPLQKNKLHTIAVIGPNADSHVALRGNYTGTASNEVTVLAGIKQAVEPDIRVLYAQGSHLYKDQVEPGAHRDDRQAEAITAAENSDVVILCLGLDATIEGEQGDSSNAYGSGDKRDLKLPPTQRRLLKAIVQVGKPVVLLLNAGSAITLDGMEAKPNVKAILDIWYPGALGGQAVADVLFGKVSPSGKLPVTFYESTESLPHFTDYAMTGRTYRYLQTEPLYPFGYGLTYGHVQLSDAKITDGQVHVRAANTSAIDTEEVVQVYTKAPSADAPLNPRLSGFKRIVVQAGQTVDVEIPFAKDTFSVVNQVGQLVPVAGEYVVSVGLGQPDRRTAQLYGQQALTLKVHHEEETL